ncbi:type II toxin-antitoxin system HicA family toxin [Frigoribacterium sp. RIT-PI-h]
MTKAQKYRDVTRFLAKRGWVFKRQRGSHEMWGAGGH